MHEDIAQTPSEQQEKLIFIIEDDLEIAGILMDFLQENSPYRVIWSDSGPAAHKAMQHIQPDLLVIDYILPRISGLEFFDLVKKRPDWAHIPSIIITANPKRLGREAEERHIRVLEKPFDLETFLDVINTLLT